MLRIIIFAVALLIDPAITAGAEMPGCSQLSDLSAARLRWAAVRKKPVNPAHNEESCRSYGTNFFEAVTTRQAASFLQRGRRPATDPRAARRGDRSLYGLIATQCSGEGP